MTTSQARPPQGEWLESWDPENEKTWDQSLAWRTLWITTFCLTLAFVAWFLPSAIIPKPNALGTTSRRTSCTGWRPCRASRPACSASCG